MDSDIQDLKSLVAQLTQRVSQLESQLALVNQSLGPSQLYNPLTSAPYAQQGAASLTLQGSGGGPAVFQVFSDAVNPGPGGPNSLVAAMGTFLDPNNNTIYHGIWALNFWAGGSGPSVAPLLIDNNGIVNALKINLTLTPGVNGVQLLPLTGTPTTPPSPDLSNRSGWLKWKNASTDIFIPFWI